MCVTGKRDTGDKGALSARGQALWPVNVTEPEGKLQVGIFSVTVNHTA